MSSYWSLVEPVWDAISIYDGPEEFLAQFGAANAVSRTLFAAHWCQSEVQNGGLHQFFHNSTGVLAPEAAAAFDALEMPKTADVVRSAISWFGLEFPGFSGEMNIEGSTVRGGGYGEANPRRSSPPGLQVH
jgi:hypothetical protein